MALLPKIQVGPIRIYTMQDGFRPALRDIKAVQAKLQA